ncbi:MAG: acylphosphatase [Vicinamibacterales bacterium]
MRTARRYLVSGRVQGVGYRYFVLEAARREDLHGWVRNLDDGRVEVEAEGAGDALERFERALWRGPAHARVEAVAADDIGPGHHAASFTVA